MVDVVVLLPGSCMFIRISCNREMKALMQVARANLGDRSDFLNFFCFSHLGQTWGKGITNAVVE